MKLLVTGDMHADIFLFKRIVEDMGKNEILLIAGDFGMFWFDTESRMEKYRIINNMLEEKNSYVAFVDGNHEQHNYINSQKIEEFCGAKCHKLMNRIIHIIRGEILNIEGTTIFCFGGAYSIDRSWRELDKTFFESELPSKEEYENGRINLEKAGMKVEYILTHTCPINYLNMLGARHRACEEEELQEYIQWVIDSVEYKKHYFGHWHMDKIMDNKEIALFHELRDVETSDVIGTYWRMV